MLSPGVVNLSTQRSTDFLKSEQPSSKEAREVPTYEGNEQTLKDPKGSC